MGGAIVGLIGFATVAKISATATYDQVSLRADLFFRNLPAPAQYLRLRAGGFGFLDVASAIVKQGQTCPADLIVRAKLDRLLTGIDGFVETSEFH